MKEIRTATSSTSSAAAVIPCLRYRDVPAAIVWLCQVFGFDKHLVVPEEDNTIAHAQLSLGARGLVMLCSTARDTEFARLIAQPGEVGGRETQSHYLVVPDADAVYAHVKAAGGGIVRDIQDEDYGGRGFTCRNLEGHVWSAGTHNPWAKVDMGLARSAGLVS